MLELSAETMQNYAQVFHKAINDFHRPQQLSNQTELKSYEHPQHFTFTTMAACIMYTD